MKAGKFWLLRTKLRWHKIRMKKCWTEGTRTLRHPQIALDSLWVWKPAAPKSTQMRSPPNTPALRDPEKANGYMGMLDMCHFGPPLKHDPTSLATTFKAVQPLLEKSPAFLHWGGGCFGQASLLALLGHGFGREGPQQAGEEAVHEGLLAS